MTDLQLSGRTVTQVAFDHAVTLLLEADVSVRLEAAFTLAGLTVVPETRTNVSAALGVLHTEVTAAEADDTGTLRLTFAGGVALTAGPDDDYEAWTLTGPGSRRLVAGPGGGLSSWS